MTYSYCMQNFIQNFCIINTVNTKIIALVCVLAIPSFIAGVAVLPADASTSWGYDGALVYEQPTDLTELSRVPLQLLVGLGVAVAAIAIFVLYKTRK